MVLQIYTPNYLSHWRVGPNSSLLASESFNVHEVIVLLLRWQGRYRVQSDSFLDRQAFAILNVHVSIRLTILRLGATNHHQRLIPVIAALRRHLGTPVV